MKGSIIGVLFLVLSTCISCEGTESPNEPKSPPIADKDTTIAGAFSQFLGIDYGMEEQLLQSRLGKFTSGNYTADSSAFIYYFNRVERVPISVWVSTKTAKVITIFIEVLSLGENFEADLAKAINEYQISPEDASWLGLTAQEIKAKMGPPAEEAVSKEGVSLLSYDLHHYLCTVAFKIYPQQDHKCSSVSVNWFY